MSHQCSEGWSLPMEVLGVASILMCCTDSCTTFDRDGGSRELQAPPPPMCCEHAGHSISNVLHLPRSQLKGSKQIKPLCYRIWHCVPNRMEASMTKSDLMLLGELRWRHPCPSAI
ncbi:hypothetical protein BDA96_08G141500 [Sorghum bicolor]|uniref:Uncharacterized protein n=1 Tax=Sorghum bicolor TaxID=4558 RepID=A0A921QFX2_SORBI|nr:hypothetical protein BDA96_08G141500 [Sorghum bicolor]